MEQLKDFREEQAYTARVQQMLLLPIGFPGKNREMHPHRVQLLHAEVSVHPVLVHFGDYDGVS